MIQYMKNLHKIINLLNSCTKKTRLNCEQGSINLRLYKSVKNDIAHGNCNKIMNYIILKYYEKLS